MYHDSKPPYKWAGGWRFYMYKSFTGEPISISNYKMSCDQMDGQPLDSIVVNLNVLSQLFEVAIVSCPPEKAPVVGLVMWRMHFIKKLWHWKDSSPYVRIKEHGDRKPFLRLVHHNTVFHSAVFVIAPDLEDGTNIDHKCILARFHWYPLSVLPLDLKGTRPRNYFHILVSRLA